MTGGSGKHPGSQRRFRERKDPTLTRQPSFSMGGKYNDEVDKLAANNPFYPQGTHRAQYGQALLTDGRCFDKTKQDALQALGRQWKATPGPGRYKTQRCIGALSSGGSALTDNADVTRNFIFREPGWKFGSGPTCTYMKDQAGTSYYTPGPGTYKTWTHFKPDEASNSGPSGFNRWAQGPCSKDQVCAPDIARSASYKIPLKTVNDTDRLSSMNPFYQSGTHRANYGDTFLTNGRLRDDKRINELIAQGKHWKQTPGAGAYKTPICVGGPGFSEKSGEMKMDRTRITHEPAWVFGTGEQITYYKMPGVVVDSPGPAAYDKYVEIT